MSKGKSNSSDGIDSVWKSDPGSGEWNTTENWDADAVPDATADFVASTKTTIKFQQGSDLKVETIKFGGAAPEYTFEFKFPQPAQPVAEPPALTIAGQGVINESQGTQKFIIASAGYSYRNPQLQFINTANAGDASVAYSVGPATAEGYGGGVLGFSNGASAGSAMFTVTTGSGTPPKKNSTVGAEVSFGDHSTAATATFMIYGSTSLLDGDTFANVVFHQKATVDHAKMTNAGGTVPGGDGGNTQFYNSSTAANGVFQNQGGTAYGQLSVLKDGKIVPKVGKDGPEMQGANGGDVAFDGTATGHEGEFHNQAAPTAGAHGGVTSFNNNWPPVEVPKGASAGSGTFYNYGAVADPKEGNGPQKGGGGHTEFTALWGCPSADHGTFHNYGSDTSYSKSSNLHGSCAGYTVFSITTGKPSIVGDVKYPDEKAKYGGSDATEASGEYGVVEKDGNEFRYFPTAGNGEFHNYPAVSKAGQAGCTKFGVYPPYSPKPNHPDPNGNVPTAGSGTFLNYGAKVSGASGGFTEFSETTNADQATLVATGGTNGGDGGRIVFYGSSSGAPSGGTATIVLDGNGTLDIAYYVQPVLTIGHLKVGTGEMSGGTVKTSLGADTTCLEVSGELTIEGVLTFYFSKKYEKKEDTKYDTKYGTRYHRHWNNDEYEDDDTNFERGKPYVILRAPNLESFSPEHFTGNSVDGAEPTFERDGDALIVSFH